MCQDNNKLSFLYWFFYGYCVSIRLTIILIIKTALGIIKEKIIHKIKTIMQSHEKYKLFSFSSLLYIISCAYGAGVKLRNFFYKKGIFRSKKLGCKVISIGNLTVGGTGKTPMTIYIAKLISRLGYKVVVLSRGYKGRAEKTGGIVSNGRSRSILMTPEMSGDEPFLMAVKLENIPVVVGRNRFKAGMSAIREFNPDVIILDDAFQHRQLLRDINIVLIDSACPFGNMHLLPRGILREPVSSVGRGDIFILTRSDSGTNSVNILSLKKHTDNKPVFKAVHIPHIYKIIKKGGNKKQLCLNSCDHNYDNRFLKGRSVYAFSGIAKNNDFIRSVEAFGCKLIAFTGFQDHHFYSDTDLAEIFKSAKDAKADFILTTDKDYIKIAGRTNTISLPADLVVVGIKIAIKDENENAAFNALIKNLMIS